VKLGRKDAFYPALLLALSLAFFWRLLGLQGVYYQEDFSPLQFPYFHWLHLHYAAGQEPLWCQAKLLGYPVYDEGALNFYWPLRLLLKFFDAVPAVAWHNALHAAWAGLGSYCLLRLKRQSAEGSLLGALVTELGGNMVYACYGYVLMVNFAWFPWMLLGLELAQGQGDIKKLAAHQQAAQRLAGAACLGFAAGMMLLGGHLGLTLHALTALAFLHACWVFSQEAKGQRLAAWASLTLSILVAALLAGGWLMALRRYEALSLRSQAFDYAEASTYSLNPLSFIHLLLPYAFGTQNDGSFLGMAWRFGSWQPQGMLVYVGLLSLGLLGWSLSSKSRRGQAWPWLGAWALLLAYGMGPWTPLHRLFFQLPVFSHTHGPMRAAIFSSALLAFPVALGFDAIFEGEAWPARLRASAWIFAAGALSLGLAALALKLAHPWLLAQGQAYIQAKVLHSYAHSQPAAYYMDKVLRWLARLAWDLRHQAFWLAAYGLALFILAKVSLEDSKRLVAAGLALGLIFFGECYDQGASYFALVSPSYYQQRPKSVDWIRSHEAPRGEPFRIFSWGWAAIIHDSFPQGRMEGDFAGEQRITELVSGDACLSYGLQNFGGYTPVGLSRVKLLLGQINDFSPGNEGDELTRQLLARRRVLDLGGVRFILSAKVLKAPGLALQSKDVVRIYRNERALPLACFADSVSVASGPEEALERALKSPARAPAVLEIPQAEVHGKPAGSGKVRWLSYEDLQWTLQASSPRGGWLLLSRSYYPELWKAEVDAKPAPLLAANGAFCALWLEAGKHEVRIRYEDPGLAAAWVLHALGWVFTALLILLAFLEGKKEDGTEKNQ
jgi:hypothetical protein